MDLNIDVDELLLDQSRFSPLPTIAYDTPIVPLIESCLRWQSEGIPFVIKGVRLEGRESPFLNARGWQAKLPRPLGEYTWSLQTKELAHEPIVRREFSRWRPGGQ